MYYSGHYGMFSAKLKALADIDGYVPEPGDHWSDLRYDAMCEWDDDSWSGYVAECEEAKQEADAAIAAWRERNTA